MAVWAKTIEIVSSPDERNPYIRIVLNFGSHHMCLIDIVRFARAEMYLNWKPVVHRSYGVCWMCAICMCTHVCIWQKPTSGVLPNRSIDWVCCVCVCGGGFSGGLEFGQPSFRRFVYVKTVGGRWTRWPLIDLNPIQICRSIEIVCWGIMVSWRRVNVVMMSVE